MSNNIQTLQLLPIVAADCRDDDPNCVGFVPSSEAIEEIEAIEKSFLAAESRVGQLRLG